MGHVQYMSAVAGIPESKTFAIENPGSLDARRRAAFPFVRKLTLEPASITREDVDALRPHFKDKEIVQLIFAVCHFNTMNRLADGFGVPLEEENVFAAPAKPEKPAPAPRPKPRLL
jgi:alkylhydroperoxidase family enzyme